MDDETLLSFIFTRAWSKTFIKPFVLKFENPRNTFFKLTFVLEKKTKKTNLGLSYVMPLKIFVFRILCMPFCMLPLLPHTSLSWHCSNPFIPPKRLLPWKRSCIACMDPFCGDLFVPPVLASESNAATVLLATIPLKPSSASPKEIECAIQKGIRELLLWKHYWRIAIRMHVHVAGSEATETVLSTYWAVLSLTEIRLLLNHKYNYVWICIYV
jgi:hypothetical protein